LNRNLSCDGFLVFKFFHRHIGHCPEDYIAEDRLSDTGILPFVATLPVKSTGSRIIWI